jgi:hypothetical protein
MFSPAMLGSAAGAQAKTYLEWKNASSSSTVKGIDLSPMIYYHTGNVGMKISFKVRMAEPNYTTNRCILTKSGSTSNEVIAISGTNTLRMRTTDYTISGLNWFDGQTHEVSIEKVSSSQAEITVDNFAPVAFTVGTTIEYDLLYGWYDTAQQHLLGRIWDFKYLPYTGVDHLHIIPLTDGAGAGSLVNNGTGTASINAIEGTDYDWLP